MKEKDKGVTLIELIITLSLLSILLSFSLISIDSLKNYENNIDIDYCNNSILELIDNAKLYCKKENSNGYIQFDLLENEIMFNCYSNKTNEFEKIEKYILPRKFTIYYINSEYNRIRINIYGTSADGMSIYGTGLNGMTPSAATTDSCTIKFRDRRGNLHTITIRVGTNYVQVKE